MCMNILYTLAYIYIYIITWKDYRPLCFFLSNDQDGFLKFYYCSWKWCMKINKILWKQYWHFDMVFKWIQDLDPRQKWPYKMNIQSFIVMLHRLCDGGQNVWTFGRRSSWSVMVGFLSMPHYVEAQYSVAWWVEVVNLQ